jgi:hypothetical protein
MIKKGIVIVQLAAALLLGIAIIGQLGMTPDKARRINRNETLWFMHPWRPDSPGTAEAPAPSAQAQVDASGTAQAILIRRCILSPSPALDAMVTALQNKDLEASGPVFIPARTEPAKPEVRKQVHSAPVKHKKKAVPGGANTVTSLVVSTVANGVLLKGLTAAPVERMDLYTYTSPPRMILELYGPFAAYKQPVTVPPNEILESVTTQVSPNKLRIIGTLRSGKVSVAPVTRASSRDAFSVELTVGTNGQPQGQPAR